MELSVGCHDTERAVGIERVQRLGNQDVDIVVVKLKRGQAVWIVGNIERDAQRIVILWDFAERGQLAFAAAGMRGLRLHAPADGMQAAVNVGAQNIWQFGLAADVDQEDDQHQREESTGDFEREPRPAPATPLLIVENGLAFRHESIQCMGQAMVQATGASSP